MSKEKEPHQPAPPHQPQGPPGSGANPVLAGAPDGVRVAALLAEAQALGYDVVPRTRILTGPTPAELVAQRTAEAQKALSELKAPLPAEGKGMYLVTFAGEAATAVDADGKEDAVEKAKVQLGVISAAQLPAVVRVR